MQVKIETPDVIPPTCCREGAARSITWLRQAHEEQLAMCRELEEIADSLPENVNRQKCLYAAKALGPLVTSVHTYEETVFFPWLERQTGQNQSLHDTLTRLKFEHCEDECYAEELADALLRLGSGHIVNMEALGYMLRGFFEVIRRHLAFEREHFLQDIPANTLIVPPH